MANPQISSSSSTCSNESSHSESTQTMHNSPDPNSTLKKNQENEKRPKKRARESGNKHPVFRGVRMRSWGKWVSEKGDSAVLNFPHLVDLLPRPHSLSPQDIQLAAAKAAAMEELTPPSASSSSSSSSSLSSLATAEVKSVSVENSSPSSDNDLGEIIELPSLDSFWLSTELKLVDSVEGWLYPPWWASNTEYCGYLLEQDSALMLPSLM